MAYESCEKTIHHPAVRDMGKDGGDYVVCLRRGYAREINCPEYSVSNPRRRWPTGKTTRIVVHYDRLAAWLGTRSCVVRVVVGEDGETRLVSGHWQLISNVLAGFESHVLEQTKRAGC